MVTYPITMVKGNSDTTMDGDSYTVVLYARVSTDDKGQTNETQIRDLRAFCQKNSWQIADRGTAIYTDEQTARNDKRPGFRELKGRISEGDIDFVVARNQDRISREPSDYQAFIKYCQTYRVRVRYIDNPARPESTEGVIMDSVMAGLAKADNMKRSAATTAGMKTAQLRGVHCGRPMSFCWADEVEQNRSKIIFDDSDGHVRKTAIADINMIMSFADKGISIGKAAEAYHIARSTLVNALRERGMLDDYLVRFHAANPARDREYNFKRGND